MIFVTEEDPESGGETRGEGRGRRDVFQVLMLHHSGVSSDRGGDRVTWEAGNTQGIERTQGHLKCSHVSDDSHVHPGSPRPTLAQCPGRSMLAS